MGMLTSMNSCFCLIALALSAYCQCNKMIIRRKYSHFWQQDRYRSGLSGKEIFIPYKNLNSRLVKQFRAVSYWQNKNAMISLLFSFCCMLAYVCHHFAMCS